MLACLHCLHLPLALTNDVATIVFRLDDDVELSHLLFWLIYNGVATGNNAPCLHQHRVFFLRVGIGAEIVNVEKSLNILRGIVVDGESIPSRLHLHRLYESNRSGVECAERYRNSGTFRTVTELYCHFGRHVLCSFVEACKR